MSNVKAAILNLVKTVQGEMEKGDNGVGLHSLSTRANSPFPPPADGSYQQTVELRLQFGRGYFDGRKCLFWVDDEFEEVETEEAVSAYCEERLPKNWVIREKEPPRPATCVVCNGTGKIAGGECYACGNIVPPPDAKGG